MDILTEKLDILSDLLNDIQHHKTSDTYWSKEREQAFSEAINALERLAEYEETGLTPEQLKEVDNLYLEKCEEVNRLKAFEPPCKVGDTIYCIIEDELCETPPYYISDRSTVVGIVLKADGWYVLDNDGNIDKAGSDDAFLTKEDAEKRLAELRSEVK